MTLSEYLIQYRESHGLSQRQLALQCSVSNGYISMLERNVNPSTGEPVVPTIPTLKKIANGLGITLDMLFANVDDMPISMEDTSFDAPLAPAVSLSPAEHQLVESYRRAPQNIRSIVDTALAPYSPRASEESAV